MKKTLSTLILVGILFCSLLSFNALFFGLAEAGTNVGGIITSDITWTKANSPYTLTKPLAVNAGVTLKIEPGTTVNLNEYSILVNGTLSAKGTASDRIVFNDGEIDFAEISEPWNEQNCTGNIVQYAIFRYQHHTGSNSLTFLYSYFAAAKFDHNILYGNDSEYTNNLIIAGAATVTNNLLYGTYRTHGIGCDKNSVVLDNKIANCEQGISAYYGNPIIKRNLIVNCSIRGLMLTDGGFSTSNPIIEGNTIINNRVGIEFSSIAQSLINATIVNNNVYNNEVSNMYLGDSTLNHPFTPDVNATNNWWGTTDLNGIEQKIYDSSDNFNCGTAIIVPFLNQPNPSAPTEAFEPVAFPAVPESPITIWVALMVMLIALTILATSRIISKKKFSQTVL